MADSRTTGSNTLEILTRIREAEGAPLTERQALQAAFEESRRIEDDPSPTDIEAIRKWLKFAEDRTDVALEGGTDRPASREVLISLREKLATAEAHAVEAQSIAAAAQLSPDILFQQLQVLTASNAPPDQIARTEDQHRAAVDRFVTNVAALRQQPFERWAYVSRLLESVTSPLLRQRLEALRDSELKGQSLSATFLGKAFFNEAGMGGERKEFAERVIRPLLDRTLAVEVRRVRAFRSNSDTWKRLLAEAKKQGTPNQLVAEISIQLQKQLAAEKALAGKLTTPATTHPPATAATGAEPARVIHPRSWFRSHPPSVRATINAPVLLRQSPDWFSPSIQRLSVGTLVQTFEGAHSGATFNAPEGWEHILVVNDRNYGFVPARFLSAPGAPLRRIRSRSFIAPGGPAF